MDIAQQIYSTLIILSQKKLPSRCAGKKSSPFFKLAFFTPSGTLLLFNRNVPQAPVSFSCNSANRVCSILFTSLQVNAMDSFRVLCFEYFVLLICSFVSHKLKYLFTAQKTHEHIIFCLPIEQHSSTLLEDWKPAPLICTVITTPHWRMDMITTIILLLYRWWRWRLNQCRTRRCLFDLCFKYIKVQTYILSLIITSFIMISFAVVLVQWLITIRNIILLFITYFSKAVPKKVHPGSNHHLAPLEFPKSSRNAAFSLILSLTRAVACCFFTESSVFGRPTCFFFVSSKSLDVFGFARVFSREDPANNSSITALFPPTYVFVDGRRFGAIAEPTHYEKNSMKRTLQNHDFLGNFSFKMYEEINQDCERFPTTRLVTSGNTVTS